MEKIENLHTKMWAITDRKAWRRKTFISFWYRKMGFYPRNKQFLFKIHFDKTKKKKNSKLSVTAYRPINIDKYPLQSLDSGINWLVNKDPNFCKRFWCFFAFLIQFWTLNTNICRLAEQILTKLSAKHLYSLDLNNLRSKSKKELNWKRKHQNPTKTRKCYINYFAMEEWI